VQRPFLPGIEHVHEMIHEQRQLQDVLSDNVEPLAAGKAFTAVG
jgi:hypothetical protein